LEGTKGAKGTESKLGTKEYSACLFSLLEKLRDTKEKHAYLSLKAQLLFVACWMLILLHGQTMNQMLLIEPTSNIST